MGADAHIPGMFGKSKIFGVPIEIPRRGAPGKKLLIDRHGTWVSLRGTMAGRYGLRFTLGKEGYELHGVATHLIDKSGNLRARYHGLKFSRTNIIVHINTLTNDTH